MLGKDVISCQGCVDKQFYNRQSPLKRNPSSTLHTDHSQDFSQVTTIEKNWNLTNIPNPDGDGPQWDSWMLPFACLGKC